MIIPPYFAQIESALTGGFHLICTGPRGTGKTTSIRSIAKTRQKRLITVQGHNDLTIEDLRGCQTLVGGSSQFHLGPAVTAAKEGHYLFIDEANLVRPGQLAWLNNGMDKSGIIAVPETGEEFAVHSEFRCFLAFNEGYAGTREVNPALKDRFRVVFCDYWPAEQETQALREFYPGIAPIDASRIVSVANAVRAARKEGVTEFDFSIRTMQQWAWDACERTLDLLESFKAVVLPKVGDPILHGPECDALCHIAALHLSRQSEVTGNFSKSRSRS